MEAANNNEKKHEQIAQVDYQKLTQEAHASKEKTNLNPEKEEYNRITKDFVVHSTSQLQTPVIVTPAETQTIRTFSSRSIPLPTLNIGGIIKKITLILLISLPILIILSSIVLFLIENSYNFAALTQYPNWVNSQLEGVVKKFLIPNIRN